MFRGFQILLSEHRRQEKNVANVVETVAARVDGEIAGRLQIQSLALTRSPNAVSGDLPFCWSDSELG
jgi:hypothetical protein